MNPCELSPHEPKEIPVARTATQQHPLIPTDYVETMTFQAPIWGITSRPHELDRELSWIQLVVDLGIQMYVWVLAPSSNVGALMQRKMRPFTLRHAHDGLLIKEIGTSGLAHEEHDGYAVALATL